MQRQLAIPDCSRKTATLSCWRAGIRSGCQPLVFQDWGQIQPSIWHVPTIHLEVVLAKLGIRAQEWLSNALMLLGSKHFGTKFLGLCYLSLAALPILMWNWADRFSEKNSLNSNAVYFELKKT